MVDSVLFFFSDFNNVPVNLVVENTFLDIECWFGYDNIIFQGLHLQLGNGNKIIVEQKCDAADKQQR